jgi:uncharacterized protein YbjT (DUF2867 family)
VINLKILVTGSSGHLGTVLLKTLSNSDYEVKLTSRRKPSFSQNFEWVYSDFMTGEGLDEAVKDVDVIIHTATSPMKNTKEIDVTGLEILLSKVQHIKHFIYPSIVGIDEIPFSYYRYKYEAEKLLNNHSIPYTIVRAAQFHSFVHNLFLSKPLFHRYFVPGKMKFQSVDTGEFANHLLDFIDKGPQGRVDDFCGPEIMTLREMAEQKIKINNESNQVMSIPLAGKLYKSLIQGKNTNESRKKGLVTFAEFLKNQREN